MAIDNMARTTSNRMGRTTSANINMGRTESKAKFYQAQSFRDMAAENIARITSSAKLWARQSFWEVWTDPSEGFRNTFRINDDEEEPKWAALERLPTYDRMRKENLKQVLDNEDVSHDEVDITNLGAQDKKQLMESILKVVENDNEQFLRRLRNRTDKVGIQIPTIEVRFDRLWIEGDTYVGSRAVPTLLNATLNVIEALLGLIRLSRLKKRINKILRDVSGIVKPSRHDRILTK